MMVVGGRILPSSAPPSPLCRWACPHLGGRKGATWHRRWQRENSLSLSDRPASAPWQHNRTVMCEPSFASVASHDGRRTMMVGVTAAGGGSSWRAEAVAKYEGHAVFLRPNVRRRSSSAGREGRRRRRRRRHIFRILMSTKRKRTCIATPEAPNCYCSCYRR